MVGLFQQFIRRSFAEPEIIPLATVVCVALASAGFMGVHQARSPDVVWNHKTNEYPWQQVRPGDQTKLLAFNQKYQRRFDRKEW